VELADPRRSRKQHANVRLARIVSQEPLRPIAASRWSPSRVAIALWGVGGVVLLLGEAIWRLADTALTILLREGLTAGQTAVFVVWLAFIVYVEGYRAFQKRFSPRVVARALHLCDEPRPLHVVLAPLYCMTLLHATRRRLVASWILVAGIVGIILLVRAMPPVYRAIIDAGVVCALAWGTVVMIVLFVRALLGTAPPVPLDLPSEAAPSSASLPEGRPS
jgi:hypothetical protein